MFQLTDRGNRRTEMIDDYSKFKHLIKNLENNPQASPSPDFTERIIIRLYISPADPLIWKIKKYLPSPTREEWAFSFISMGFFYLVLGLLIWLSVNTIPDSAMHNWLQFQSPVFMSIAALLTAIGGLLWFLGRKALKIVNWGLLAYILMFAFAGIMTFQDGKMQVILGGILCLGAILTGISLHVFVGQYAYSMHLNERDNP